MKYSCCIGYNAKSLETLANHGYDCFETPLASLSDKPENEIKDFKYVADSYGLYFVSHNGMFPGNFKLLDKNEYKKISDYLDAILTKSSILGTKIIVLGSGGARRIPEDMTLTDAKKYFCNLLTEIIIPKAEEYSISIAIEELRKEETNFINNCREAMEIINEVNNVRLGLLIDYYHAILGGDTEEDFVSFGQKILHVHMASPKDNRLFPKMKNLDELKIFFSALKRVEYKGAVSLEGGDGGNFESAISEALSVMKEAENQ